MAVRVPAIQFDAVTYTQPSGARIFDALTLSVNAGEVLALVGRSGAGKTTLLRLVNRLALPQSGRVLVDGRDTREWDPIRLRRSIGYVIQDVGLFPHMTVADNIGVVPRLENWDPTRISDPDEGAARARRPVLGHACRALAGRAVRRTAAAGRRGASVGSGSAQCCSWTSRSVRSIRSRAPSCSVNSGGIQSRLRKTVIIVTHDMLEALSLAHRVAVLDEGAVIAFDAPERIVQATDPRVRKLLDAVTLKLGPEA